MEAEKLSAARSGSAAVFLDFRSAQAGEPMLVDGHLPRQEFFDGQRVALTCLFKAQKSAANRGHNLRLAPDNPALRAGRGKVRDCERASVGPDHIFHARADMFSHEE